MPTGQHDAVSATQGDSAPAAPVRLRCEYLANPLGVHSVRPRLKWELNDPRRGARQAAYQILVADSPEALDADEGNLWDTGRVASDQTSHVEYDGRPLAARSAAWWKVRTWDDNGRVSPWSAAGRWSVGLLEAHDWEAKWIGGDGAEEIGDPIRGYRGESVGTPRETRSISIDVGRLVPLDTFILHPAVNSHGGVVPLPASYRIEVAEQSDFSDAAAVVNWPGDDTAEADAHCKPQLHEIEPVRCRYVRLVADELTEVDKGRYALVIGGWQVLAANQNLALGAEITATDSVEGDGWSLRSLSKAGPAWRREDSARTKAPPLLRREFEVSATAVRQARVYVSALGLYELRLNGRPVGDQALAPEWTHYGVRLQYQVYDVTSFLQQGANAVGMMLGHGWYAGKVGLSLVMPGYPEAGLYGHDPMGLVQLEIEYADGRVQRVVSDSSWRATHAGPIRAANILDGEWYDARAEQPGWDQAGFEDADWRPARLADAPKVQLVAQSNEPIRKISELHPVSIRRVKSDVHVFDFGQNFAGWCRLRFRAPRGTVITLRHVEMLTEAGAIYTANLRRAAQLDRYVARGEGVEIFEPRFTYHGFRYVEVRGLAEQPTADTLVGCVVSSSAPHVGEFACSDELINRLWSNILWTQRANQHGIPTDCPQRDERLGWSGDSTAFAATACLNMNLAAFFDKWLRDMGDAQTSDGRLPDFAPHPYDPEQRFSGAPGWGDAGVFVAWELYRAYGDRKMLERHYEPARRWVEWIHANNPDLLWKNNRGNDYGDWLNADTLKLDGWPDHGAEVPKEIFATAFFARSSALLAKMARVLEKQDDAERYAALAENVRTEFNRAYVNGEATISGNTQAGYAIALSFDLLPDELREKAARRMVAAFEHFKGRISTGFFSTAYLMNELARWGYVEEGYRLLANRDMPSWGYTIEQGATTMWERWDGFVAGRGFQDPGMNSFCHCALGSVGEWLYRTIAGINLHAEVPAYREFELRPLPGGDLTWARGAHHGIYGRIVSAWRLSGGEFTLEVTVPANTRATLYMPPQADGEVTEGGRPAADAEGVTVLQPENGRAQYRLEAGSYTFRTGWREDA